MDIVQFSGKQLHAYVFFFRIFIVNFYGQINILFLLFNIVKKLECLLFGLCSFDFLKLFSEVFILFTNWEIKVVKKTVCDYFFLIFCRFFFRKDNYHGLLGFKDEHCSKICEFFMIDSKKMWQLNNLHKRINVVWKISYRKCWSTRK